MYKHLIKILFIALLPAFNASAQQPAATGADRSGENGTYSYEREKTSVPYTVKRSVAKQRRIATRQGYRSFKKGDLSTSVKKYRNALQTDSNYSKAQYNIAIAHSKMGQNDTALAYYRRTCQNNSTSPQTRAKAHYNAGNIHLRKALSARDTGGYDGQSLKAAIEEYKASLRLDCKNHDAQHNLSIAKQLLRPETESGGGGGGQKDQQNQQQDQQNQQQDKQNQQQNKQQGSQDQQQQQQQNQQQQQQNQQQGSQDKRQQEQRRREAERMLNAMKNNEQQTMKAIRMREAEKERRTGTPAKIEKDW